MRIWAISDLQLDSNPDISHLDVEVEADVCVVAGDAFRPLRRSIISLAPLARSRPLVYVPGNRDFYGCVMETELETARKIAEDLGVILLSDTSAIVGDTRFIGATLWTDLKGAETDLQRSGIAGRIADFEQINTTTGIWTPAKQVEAHDKSLAFINETLAVTHEGPTVVVSHHAPHPKSVAGHYVKDPLTPAFVSDLSDIMEGPDAPGMWIHGGLHRNVDYSVGGTRVFSNSRGYVNNLTGQENPSFKMDRVIEIERPALALTPA